MTFNIKINLKETNSQVNKKILDALKPQVNTYLRKVFSSVKQPIRETIVAAIKAAPEYSSLLSGDLKYEFGLPDSDQRLSTLLKFWEKIYVEYTPVSVLSSQLKGKFYVSMVKSDFSDVLASEVATLKTEKKQNLDWLAWLLLFGNQTIIKDYSVEFGANPRSRTGFAVMRGVKSGKWSVPPEFAGTMNDNWITRAIDSSESQINTILLDALKGSI